MSINATHCTQSHSGEHLVAKRLLQSRNMFRKKKLVAGSHRTEWKYDSCLYVCISSMLVLVVTTMFMEHLRHLANASDNE